MVRVEDLTESFKVEVTSSVRGGEKEMCLQLIQSRVVVKTKNIMTTKPIAPEMSKTY